VKLGNPNLRHDGAKYAPIGGAASADLARSRANYMRPLYESAKASGAATYQQLGNYLNKMRITTLRGKQWCPARVQRLEHLLEE
jgi:hypothetical protein